MDVTSLALSSFQSSFAYQSVNSGAVMASNNQNISNLGEINIYF